MKRTPLQKEFVCPLIIKLAKVPIIMISKIERKVSCLSQCTIAFPPYDTDWPKYDFYLFSTRSGLPKAPFLLRC